MGLENEMVSCYILEMAGGGHFLSMSHEVANIIIPIWTIVRANSPIKFLVHEQAYLYPYFNLR